MFCEEFDFKIKQGAPWARTVFWLNPDRSPVNVTGGSAQMQVRPSPSSDVILIDLDTADGSLVLGGADGSISWNVPVATIAELVAPPLSLWRDPRTGEVMNRLGTYDLFVTLGGEPFAILNGVVYLELSSTR